MTEEPAARTRARLEKTKGRHRAKIEILNEILNWIELGKSFEDIQQIKRSGESTKYIKKIRLSSTKETL
jgi:hypothetical protein